MISRRSPHRGRYPELVQDSVLRSVSNHMKLPLDYLYETSPLERGGERGRWKSDRSGSFSARGRSVSAEEREDVEGGVGAGIVGGKSVAKGSSGLRANSGRCKTVRRWLRIWALGSRAGRDLGGGSSTSLAPRTLIGSRNLTRGCFPPFAGPVQMRMSPAHVRPNGPPALHARIASMLDFPTLDEPCEGLANGEGRSRAQVPIALIVALAN